jgi:predicted O-methyltransferase YrrM
LPFPKPWFEKISYFQGEAKTSYEKSSDHYDLVLIDGQKSDYLEFLEMTLTKGLNPGAVIIIDNTFWKGSVVLDDQASKSSTKAMREFHLKIQVMSKEKKINLNYLPFRDGIIQICTRI